MATNQLVAQVPCGAGQGHNDFDQMINFLHFPSFPPFELGNALNIGDCGLGLQWPNDAGYPSHSSTPPLLARGFHVPMWDGGTNSPDGQLPAVVAVSNIRIQVSPAILSAAVGTANVFTLRGWVANGGDFFSTPVSYSVDTHPSLVTFDYPISPITGLAWTRAELFASEFGMIVDSVDTWAPGVNSNFQGFYPVGGPFPFFTPGFASNEITAFAVIVTYTSPTTYDVETTLDVASALSLAGSGTAKGGGHEVSLGAEAVIDSHLGSGLVIDVPTTNRWELQRFSVRPTKQGDR